MARHTIQIPINKSSNDSFSSENYVYVDYRKHYRYFDDNPAVVYNSTPAPSAGPVSTKLYNAYLIKALYYSYHDSPGTYLATFGKTNVIRFGIGWNPALIPQNKILISAKIYFYSVTSHSRVIYYSRGNFTEGSLIPNLTAYGAKHDGINSGWDYIDVGVNAIVDNDSSCLIFRSMLQTTENIYNKTSIYEYIESTGEYWELYSHRDPTYAPYIELVYDDLPPEQPSGLAPSSETLNPRAVIRFSWKHNSPEGAAQKAFELQWSSDGGSSWATITQTSTNEYYDMPASTLPSSGVITWRVRTTDINDEVSDYNTTAFTAGVVPQKAPLAVAPIGTYKNKATVIRFEWVFLGGATGETQSKFDLDYSADNGANWTTVTQTSGNQYYDLAANTLDIGSIVWRVRTYNEYDEVSPYSTEKYFAVIGTPGSPLIGAITNASRPLISWSSSDQVIIDLEIKKDTDTVYTTGTIPSTLKSYQVTEYLEDGSYTVRLRIANAFEMWSSWVEKSFTINPTRPTKPEISAEIENYSLLLAVGGASVTNLIYRDGEPIGEVVNGIFRDYTAGNNIEHSYFVRVIDEYDNYSDSDPVTEALIFKGNTIALASAPEDYLVIKSGFGSPIDKVDSFNQSASLVSFDGRELSVAEYSGKRYRTKTVTAFLSKEERDKFISMLKMSEPFIYRDTDGDVIVGVVSGLQSGKNYFGYDVNFMISEVEV